MDTREIEATLKVAALKLWQGSDAQKAFGEQIHDIALDLAKERKASHQPRDPETLNGIHTGKANPILPSRRK